MRAGRVAVLFLAGGLSCPHELRTPDRVREIQARAVREGSGAVAHWGPDPAHYVSWSTHTTRLVPLYTFGTRGGGPGVDLDSYAGPASVYRSVESLARLYGEPPANTLAPDAEYLDQTDVAALQRAALAAGRRHLFLVVFDGLDWHSTRAAAIHRSGRVAYTEGRGTGLHFLDYLAEDTTQFGFTVTATLGERYVGDAGTQRVNARAGGLGGGYDPRAGGLTPWTEGADPVYASGQSPGGARHAIPDSAATATALCAGIKTFNGAINVDAQGRQHSTVAHEAQAAGLAVGVVTNVPLSHATPAAAYAHNVSRWDYQDLSRDLLGRPSVAHPDPPLAGLDVLIGCGWGVEATTGGAQGDNFVRGNRYLTRRDLRAVDATDGGAYVVSMRTPGASGAERLAAAAAQAAESGRRLLGFYGVPAGGGHLPYRTADGDHAPAPGRGGTAERYQPAELRENPTLAQMTAAALRVLERDPDGLWLMVEAGDVDWASHDANLDTLIGAVLDGDDAVRMITEWVDSHSSWDEALLIVTSDHGHGLVLERPEGLLDSRP